MKNIEEENLATENDKMEGMWQVLAVLWLIKVCRTTDSRKSDCKYGGAGSQSVLIMDPSSTGTMQRIVNEKSILDEPDSPLEVRHLLLSFAF